MHPMQIIGVNAKKSKDIISMSLKNLLENIIFGILVSSSYFGGILILAYLLDYTCNFDHKTEP
jgi:hypothetical protein